MVMKNVEAVVACVQILSNKLPGRLASGTKIVRTCMPVLEGWRQTGECAGTATVLRNTEFAANKKWLARTTDGLQPLPVELQIPVRTLQCCRVAATTRLHIYSRCNLQPQKTTQVTLCTRFRYPCFRISALLFQCHDEHKFPIRGHGRTHRKGRLSCARTFAHSPHHSDSGDYRLIPLMVNNSEIHRHVTRFPFYAFSIYAAIRRNAYNEWPGQRNKFPTSRLTATGDL
jgi:hypothetical protein